VFCSCGGLRAPRSALCTLTPSSGLSVSSPRNVLTESARIARGKITDLARLSAANHDAAIFPGGFGAAKNLCVLELWGLCFSPVAGDGDGGLGSQRLHGAAL